MSPHVAKPLGMAAGLCLGALVAFQAAAHTVDPDKKARFIEILAENGCKFHNFTPDEDMVEQIFASGMSRDDVKAIAESLLQSGDAVVDGPYLVLKTGGCT